MESDPHARQELRGLTPNITYKCSAADDVVCQNSMEKNWEREAGNRYVPWSIQAQRGVIKHHVGNGGANLLKPRENREIRK